MASMMSKISDDRQAAEKNLTSRCRALGHLGVPFLTNLPELEIGKGAVIELCGEEGTGKTELLLHCVRQCITPRVWKGCLLNGRQLATLWIDTDFAFSILRLVSLLEQSLDSSTPGEETANEPSANLHQRDTSKEHFPGLSGKRGTYDRSKCDSVQYSIHGKCLAPEQSKSDRATLKDHDNDIECLPVCSDSEQPPAKRLYLHDRLENTASLNVERKMCADQTVILDSSPASQLAEREEFVTSCLERLHVMRCESSEQLLVTLHTLPQLLKSSSSLALLILDSAAAFHWIDGGGGSSGGGSESVRREVAAVLRSLANDFQLLVLTSKPLLLRSQPDRGKSWRPSGEQGAVVEFMPKSWQRIIDHRFLLTRCGVCLSRQQHSDSISPRHGEGEQQVLVSKLIVQRLLAGRVTGPVFPFQISYSGVEFTR